MAEGREKGEVPLAQSIAELIPNGRVNYYKLKLIRQYRGGRASPPWDVVGWDTETDTRINKVRVLANDKNAFDIQNIDDVLSIFTGRAFRGTVGAWWNIGYDFEVLFKYAPSILRQIKDGGKATYGKYRIKYIPNKSFSISRGHKTFSHYDIAQFYHSSLAQATTDILKKTVNELKGDRGQLFQNYPLERIKEYCIEDAQNTKELADKYLSSLQAVGLFPRKLLSCGYIAGLYMKVNSDMPLLQNTPSIINSMAWMAYSGGWFDTLKRGCFESAYHYDIKSAYPAALRDLPDLRRGTWARGYHEDGLLGFYKVVLHGCPPDILPIGGSARNVRVYPFLDSPKSCYLTKIEYEKLLKDYKIEIVHGYTWMAQGALKYPFMGMVDKLFALKEQNKKNAGVYQATKEIINSLYGKCAESGYNRKLPIGQLFNPVYAAECTARARMQVYEFCRGRGDVISIMTDAVIFDGKGADVPEVAGLGGWAVEHEDKKLLMLGNGVYQFEGDKQPKTRGFSKLGFDLWQLCKTDKTELNVSKIRPRHFRECIIQDRIDKIGVFELAEKEISLNEDIKRDWSAYPDVCGNDLLNHTYQSAPLPYSLALSAPEHNKHRTAARASRTFKAIQGRQARQFIHSDLWDGEQRGLLDYEAERWAAQRGF